MVGGADTAPLAHLGLTFGEAEGVGEKVREWWLANVPDGANLSPDSLIWADLVQFVNRESRSVIAGRASGEESS